MKGARTITKLEEERSSEGMGPRLVLFFSFSLPSISSSCIVG